MPTEVIEDGIASRIAGRGEVGVCTLGEAIAELLAGYGSTDLDFPIESDVEPLVADLELVACEALSA
jgi:hypothetical protein